MAMNESIKVLLVEDDPRDIELITEFLEDWKIIIDLFIVKDGAQALDCLHRR